MRESAAPKLLDGLDDNLCGYELYHLSRPDFYGISPACVYGTGWRTKAQF